MTLRKVSFLQLLCVVLVAVNLTGIGVALFVNANLGSDTITVFVDGLHKVLDISYGSASRLYNITLLVIALFLARKHIGWMTIVYAISVGSAIDLYDGLLQGMQVAQQSMLLRIGFVLLGQLCFGITYALLIRYRRGMNQVDALTYYVVEKCNISFRVIRTGMDIILLIGGWLLGGVVGIGSIIAMSTTGFIIEYIVELMKKKERKTTDE